MAALRVLAKNPSFYLTSLASSVALILRDGLSPLSSRSLLLAQSTWSIPPASTTASGSPHPLLTPPARASACKCVSMPKECSVCAQTALESVVNLLQHACTCTHAHSANDYIHKRLFLVVCTHTHIHVHTLSFALFPSLSVFPPSLPHTQFCKHNRFINCTLGTL